MVKELEEAIDQGVILNNKFNKSIKFLKAKAKDYYGIYKSKEAVYTSNVSNISKYQNQLVSIRHCLVKYELEVEDVYREISRVKEYSNVFVAYRANLRRDLHENDSLEDSYTFLKGFKSKVMMITKSLRSDLRKIRKELLQLEEEEQAAINKLKASI